MKAIETKYLGPTNYRGSRIAAWDSDGNRLIISYDDGLNSEDMHRKAAEGLRDRMGWTGHLIAGGTKTGYVFVFLPDEYLSVLLRDEGTAPPIGAGYDVPTLEPTDR